MTPTPLPLPDRENRPPPSDFDYLNVIGNLLHIVNYTRPDCAFAVSCLARRSINYGKLYVDAVKRVVKYMFHTRHMGITYLKEKEGLVQTSQLLGKLALTLWTGNTTQMKGQSCLRMHHLAMTSVRSGVHPR